MKKNYIVVGDNNFWYATYDGMTEKQALKMVKRIAKEVKKGMFDYRGGEDDRAEELYLYEAKEITSIEI